MIKSLFLLALFACLCFYCNSKCIHNEIVSNFSTSPNKKISLKKLLSPLYLSKSQDPPVKNPQQLRIHFDYYNLDLFTSENSKYSQISNIIKYEIIPMASQYLTKRLKVNFPVQGKLYMPFDMFKCFKAYVTNEHKSIGFDTDLTIFVSAEYNKDQTFIAYAVSCLQDSDTNRPIAGMINFNLAYLRPERKNFEKMIDTTIHELTHVLGFSPKLYDDFINIEKPAVEKIWLRNANRWIVTTPKVIEIAKEHFGCNEIAGVELENDGSKGSANSHWERTILHNEIMTASDFKDPAYSKFTLALLQDSGWYTTDFTIAEPIYWGYKKGCEFLQNACHNTNFREFCTLKKNTPICSFDYYSKAECGSEKYVGKEDQCFYPINYGMDDCRDESKNDRNSEKNGELFGSFSKCFSSDIVGNGNSNKNYNLRCYKYHCDFTKKEIMVFIGEKSVICKENSQIISAPNGYSGSIFCPEFNSFCASYYEKCPNLCSAKGYCQNGKCECRAGFGGEDCSITPENYKDYFFKDESVIDKLLKPAKWIWDKIFGNNL